MGDSSEICDYSAPLSGGNGRRALSLTLSTIHERRTLREVAAVAVESSASAAASPRRQQQRESLRQLQERLAQIDRLWRQVAEADAGEVAAAMAPPPSAVAGGSFPLVSADSGGGGKHRKSWSDVNRRSLAMSDDGCNAASEAAALLPKAASDPGPNPLLRAPSLLGDIKRLSLFRGSGATLHVEVGSMQLGALQKGRAAAATASPSRNGRRDCPHTSRATNTDSTTAHDAGTSTQMLLVSSANRAFSIRKGGGHSNAEPSGNKRSSYFPAAETPTPVECPGNTCTPKRGNSSSSSVSLSELSRRSRRYSRREIGGTDSAGMLLFGREGYSGVDGVEYSSSKAVVTAVVTSTLAGVLIITLIALFLPW
ncbi:hypothetical protein CLOP_g19373 [Closterium sp. NIES-67]|nr:hypothetical protein CLOP_g19373 [Closterium sp. NIES-67]